MVLWSLWWLSTSLTLYPACVSRDTRMVNFEGSLWVAGLLSSPVR